MMKNYRLHLLLLVVLFSCNKPKNKLVDPALAVYVDRFFEEAKIREIENVSDDNLEVVFRDLSDEGLCGLGHFSYNGTELRKVEISNNFFCWEFHDDIARENLVFHELGHAVLKRTHDNVKLPNGLPGSMMCDGNVCDIFSFYTKYTLGKREFYLDKLFRAWSTTPPWGKNWIKSTTFFEDDLETQPPTGFFEVSNTDFIDNFTYDFVENPMSNSRSIQIIAKEQYENNLTGDWIIKLKNPIIEEGLGLQLEVNISTQNMEGKGIAIILRTYSSDGTELEISASGTTRNTTAIIGNISDEKYKVDIPYYPSHVQEIEIIVQILPNTSGTVYINNFTLNVME